MIINEPVFHILADDRILPDADLTDDPGTSALGRSARLRRKSSWASGITIAARFAPRGRRVREF